MSRFFFIFSEIYRVGDNRWTVNTSTTPQICDQLGTENAYKKDSYVNSSSWYEFWFAIICIDINIILDLFFYRNPTILETVSMLVIKGSTRKNIFFIDEMQRQGIILSPMCIWGKMCKWSVKNICHIISHVGLSECSQTTCYSSFPIVQSLTISARSRESERQNIIDGTHTWQ